MIIPIISLMTITFTIYIIYKICKNKRKNHEESVEDIYENWNKIQKRINPYKKHYKKIQKETQSFIWMFYWMGRYDYLKDCPMNHDLPFLFIYEARKTKKFDRIHKTEHTLIEQYALRCYTTGYLNAHREKYDNIVKHPELALRKKPNNYEDPLTPRDKEQNKNIEWKNLLKQKEGFEQYHKFTNKKQQKIIWAFYWVGREDFLCQNPFNHDLVFSMLFEEFREKEEFEKLQEDAFRCYTTGYINALKENWDQNITHPPQALTHKPYGYEDHTSQNSKNHHDKDNSFVTLSWKEIQKSQKKFKNHYKNFHNKRQKFIWTFYWVGRFDCLSYDPINHDLPFVTLYEGDESQEKIYNIYRHHIKDEENNVLKCYISGYINGIKRKNKPVPHIIEAVKHQPKNYNDPEFSAHDIMEMKMTP